MILETCLIACINAHFAWPATESWNLGDYVSRLIVKHPAPIVFKPYAAIPQKMSDKSLNVVVTIAKRETRGKCASIAIKITVARKDFPTVIKTGHLEIRRACALPSV